MSAADSPRTPPFPHRADRPAGGWPWTTGLPTLSGGSADLRPLQASDAHALAALLVGEDVIRFLAEPPASVEAYGRFIERVEGNARAGTAFVYAVVPRGLTVPVGIMQVRRLEPGFEVAEWGFVIGAAFWGTGLFAEVAGTLADFLFDRVGVRRLEARCPVRNGRGNRALRKLGAIHEGVLRQATRLGDEVHDQAIWALLADDWRAVRPGDAHLRVH